MESLLRDIFLEKKNSMIKKSIVSIFALIFCVISCSKDSDDNSIGFLSENDKVLSLKVHNDARAEVGVPNLEWSDKLAQDALNWAKVMAEQEEMFHSSNESRPGQGENLYYWCCSTGEIETFSSTPGTDASVLWYNEIHDYTYAVIGSPLNADVMIGHYTQIIWSTTTEVGIAKWKSASGKMFVAARYSPPGNVIGQFPY